MNAPPCRAKSLSPILPVADMTASIRFYVEVLGFGVALQSDSYSVLVKDSASLHLTKAENEAVLQRTRGHMSIYLEVADIQALWAHVAQYRDWFPIRDLFDREYGMREFHLKDPNDCLIFVGQNMRA